jgi:tRNA-dihydrouridine synthase
MIQETGISHFAVHFRLKDQTAKFKADWKKIKDVVNNYFILYIYMNI